MATLTATAVTLNGIPETLAAAAAGGDKFANPAANVFLVVRNGHASAARTVTIAAQYVGEADPPFRAKANKAVSVPAQSTRLVGPFPKRACNDADGFVNLTYSDAAADLTLAAFRLPGAD